MHRDLTDYEDVTQFVRAVQADKAVLVALDESALSGDRKQLALVREALSLLKRHGLPTA
ncbi:MAG: hypothetical protein JWN48_1782 [Myxococcaceae bacterium]|nr:hypothetical protein [Myxococcaceae bacterium]